MLTSKCTIWRTAARDLSRSLRIKPSMINTIEQFEERLVNLNPAANDFVLHADELIEALSPEIADSVYLPILRFFEANPEADCGAPGALVHHVESYFPNYVVALKDSVRRTPSYNGVLMINRILNSNLTATDRAEYMGLLNAVLTHRSATPQIIEMTRRFIKRRNTIDSEQPGSVGRSTAAKP